MVLILRNLSSARYQSTGTLLNDGTILVSGGEDNNGAGLSTAEVYNPVTQTSTATSNRMTIGRMNHTATLLSNGKVLISGGGSASQVGSSSANIYNPTTSTFTATTGNMVGNRTGHTATLLRNGKVLLAGGKNGTSITYLSSAETFNPATGTFTAITGNMQAARAGHSATLLPDGRVMFAGGGSSSRVFAVVTANAYDPVAGTSAALNSMTTARANFTLTLLNNGKVLAVGGYNNSSVRLSSAEIYDPLANTWSATANSLRTGIRSDHAASLLPDGRVLISGGSNGTAALSSTEIYDPVTGTFTAGNNLNGARAYHNNIVTPDGKVIVIGGSSASDTTTTTSATTAGTASAGTNWTTTSGTLQAAFATSDNIYAIFNNAGQNAEFLSNFNFNVPSNANIVGLTTTIEGNSSNATTANRQYRLGISKEASTLAGTERSGATTQLAQTTDTTSTVPSTGGTLDTWGNNSISAAEVNATNFGLRLRDNDTTAADLNFDQITLAVTYTTNSSVLSSAEIYNLNQKVSTADSTNSKYPDLVKDSSGNYQVVWQAWRAEGLSPGSAGGSWKIMSQELNNPSSGVITKQYPTGSNGSWSATGNLTTGTFTGRGIVTLPS